MAKIKLTKGELKRQRDGLKQFQRYLPTLQLKKQQLQMKIFEIRVEQDKKKALLDQLAKDIGRWVGLLADPQLLALSNQKDTQDLLVLSPWITPVKDGIIVEELNIAGADVPVLKDMRFADVEYDLFAAPLWLDAGVKKLREFVKLFIEIKIIDKQVEILQQELRVTTQRVNLFEKVKIPECQENIRVIRIYLGDQQANAVGISKVAKKKIEEAAMAG